MHDKLEPGRLHLTVDCLILTIRNGQLTLLLARRAAEPYRDFWALPGRLVGLEESADAAVHRLLHEMLPGTEAFIEQLYTFTGLDRDPRGRVASIAYLVLLPWEALEKTLQQPEVQLRCFRINQAAGLTLAGDDGTMLTAGDLAFDHGQIVQTGVTRLRGKIDYTDIGFYFLRDRGSFSLSELQTVFEAVLSTTLDDSNFRRLILGKYESTGRIVQTNQAKRQGRGRPAALYRFTP